MNKKSKLVDHVQDLIIDMVITCQNEGENVVGDYVFNEGELAQKFGVSRTTIREAVRSLEVRGFVERVHGIGIRLIDRSLQVVTRSLSDMLMRSGVDCSELLVVRRIIEVQAARLAAICATNEFEKMEKAIKIMEDEHVSYEEYVVADFDFHNLVVKATKNKTLLALVNSYEFIFKNLILASTSPGYRPEITEGYHRKIMNCIVNKDPDGAEEAMKIHLNATESNLKSLHQSTVYLGADEQNQTIVNT
jgi:GntR family transcriptional regulator, transcriptional repressor for pyruvate dehydrogenase complex